MSGLSIRRGKSLAFAAVAAIVAFSFIASSCYWNPAGGAGKITLQLSPAQARSVMATQATGGTQTARVYLYTNNMNASVTIGTGSQYVETTVGSAGGSITIDGVPPGEDYTLVLTLGSKTGTVFIPAGFGQSAAFRVSAGKSTSVNLSLVDLTAILAVPQALIGKNLTGVVFSQYTSSSVGIVASDADTLYVDTSQTIDTPTFSGTFPVPSGTPINSLSPLFNPSATAPGAWVNGSTGILQFDSNGQPAFSTPFSGAPAASVVQSGTYAAGNDTAVFYRTRSGLWGGTLPGNPAPSWLNVDMTDGTVVQPVFDMAFLATGSSDFGFFSTGAGPYAIGSDLLTGGADLNYLRTHGVYFPVQSGGVNRFVTCLAIDDPTLPANVYAGTVDGIYAAPISPIQVLLTTGGTSAITSPPLESTSGHPFLKVASTYEYGVSLFAGLSNNLIIAGPESGGLGVSTISLPVAAVCLGTPRAIMLAAQNGLVYLYIAGSEGLSVVNVAAVPG